MRRACSFIDFVPLADALIAGQAITNFVRRGAERERPSSPTSLSRERGGREKFVRAHCDVTQRARVCRLGF